jgi:hypothetical protein
MTQPVTDRLRDSMAGINAALSPRQVYMGIWEYSVISAQPGPPVVIDCTVVDAETSAHLPTQLTGLKLWPGPSGGVAVPPPGSIVRIGFVNYDPTKPYVAGLDPDKIPLQATLDASVSVAVGPSAPIVTLAGGGHPIALADVLDNFIKVFVTWVPVPTDGGAALKTLISAFVLGPPPFVTSGSLKSSTG